MGDVVRLKENNIAKIFKFQRLQWLNDGRIRNMIHLRALENIEKNKL
jgi:hypothetical protein